ncbi:MAG TPA: RHS repeat-associated core domain-containing protein [Ktedonobacteraceae bacterium]|nr:RHS repeat-associated core domain-containing protein [Ktedonobacteraceae bacterium]
MGKGHSNYPDLELCDTSTNVIYTPCVVGPLTESHANWDGNKQDNTPWTETTYTYDDISTSTGYISTGYHNLTQEVITSANMPTLTQKWSYAAPNIQKGSNGYINEYLVNEQTHSETDDSNGHVWNCQDTTYDEGGSNAAGWPTTKTSYSTCGNSSTALKTYTAYDQYGNVVATVDALGTANAGLYSGHGCSASGIVDLSSAWTTGRFTTCTTYDTTHTASLPVTQTNALGQATSTAYDYTSGAQATSSTDVNGQTTGYGYSYDGSGNETITTSEPGEGGSYTTRQSEATSCTSSSTLPCYEIDTNNSLYPNAISRTYYDQQGRAIETRTPGPTSGDDTVVETVYNDQNHTVWKSVPFQVADGSGWLDPTTTKDINGNLPAGTTTFYDALNRVIATQDPNFGSAQEPGLACSTVLTGKYTTCTNYSWGQATGDSNQYEITTHVDANGHVTESFADTVGNVRYTQTYSGVYGGTLTVTSQKQTQYNALNKPTSVSVVDEQPQSGESTTGVTTTMTYDDMGRMLTMNDPDQGNFTYTYDPDGDILSVVQSAGSDSRTLGYDYDLLGRMRCEGNAVQSTISWNGVCSGGSTLEQNTYDSTYLGTQGSTDFPVGQLTQSLFYTYYPDGSRAGVTYQYQHDQRGRAINTQMEVSVPAAWNVSTALPTYLMTQAYNDADQETTTSTSANGGNGYSFSTIYDSTNGTAQGLSNGGSTANLATLSYNEYAQLSGITLLNGAASSPASLASEAFGYDANQRPISTNANWLPGSGNSGQILNQNRAYDNAGNVTSVNTTLAAVPGQNGSGGSEVQNFCYDEQNRLIWSGNSGTQPGAGNGTCGSGTLSSGLNGANYTAPYSYTNLGQIWQGPLNGQGAAVQYLYCNSSAPHHLTNVYPLGATCANKSNYSAIATFTHDDWGNESSRTYDGVTATLSYDQFNNLVEYSAGNNQEFYVYDINGKRILKRSTSAGTTTLTVDVFGLDEYTYTGSGTLSSQLHYYSIAGHLIGSFDGTSIVFYLSDGLGSVLLDFSASTILGEQLYGPYGNSRYLVGSLTTSKGYTGQFHDALTGLDYYVARYYDPLVGIFLTVDTVQGNMLGFDPYAYVQGNPETMNDPTGQMFLATHGGGTSYTRVQSIVTSLNNTNSFMSSAYGGFSGRYGGKQWLLQRFINYGQPGRNWLNSTVKKITGVNKDFDHRVKVAQSLASDLEESRLVKSFSIVGNAALVIGAGADGLSSGLSYYQKHLDQGYAGGIVDGTLHASLSTAGSIIGADLGMVGGTAVGAMIGGPIGAAIGGFVGGAVGGFVGSWVGDQAANLLDGNITSSVNIVPAVSQAVTNFWNWLT